MESVFESLGALQRGDSVRSLAARLGADETATRDALASALPVLIGALARNASRPGGARDLSAALTRDHDGRILADLVGALAGGGGRAGEGILGHLFGTRRERVQEALGRTSGLDAAAAARLLATLAPLVMGALGRAQRERRLDEGALGDVLSNERRRAERDAPGSFGGLAQMLDADGDGDLSDDIPRLGANLLRRLFRGRR